MPSMGSRGLVRMCPTTEACEVVRTGRMVLSPRQEQCKNFGLSLHLSWYHSLPRRRGFPDWSSVKILGPFLYSFSKSVLVVPFFCCQGKHQCTYMGRHDYPREGPMPASRGQALHTAFLSHEGHVFILPVCTWQGVQGVPR